MPGCLTLFASGRCVKGVRLDARASREYAMPDSRKEGGSIPEKGWEGLARPRSARALAASRPRDSPALWALRVRACSRQAMSQI